MSQISALQSSLFHATQSPNVLDIEATDGIRNLGFRLGRQVLDTLTDIPAHIVVVCTATQADLLAHGLVQALEDAGHSQRVRLLCTWHEPFMALDRPSTAIVKQYREPFDSNNCAVVVVNSTLENDGVVEANLLRSLSYCTPSYVVVATPIACGTMPDYLRAGLPKAIGEKMRFVCMAESAENPPDGAFLFNQNNPKYVPTIVKERRQRLFVDTLAL